MTQTLIDFPTRCASGLPVLATGLIAFVAGFQQHNPGLVALGIVFLALPAIVWFRIRGSAAHVVFERTAPEAAYEGDPVQITVRLTNDSTTPVFFPQVCDVFAPEIHVQKSLSYSGVLAAGESAEQKYLGHCILPRGVYSLGPGAIRVSDPFGWFEVSRLEKDRQLFKVRPQIHRVGLAEQVGRCVSWVIDDRTRRGVGESNEFHTVRDYRRGDSPRRIHWPLTARRGIPVVREFARTATGDLTVFLDTHHEALVGWGRSSSVEYEVKIAAAVAAHALRRGRKVQLVRLDDGEPRIQRGVGAGDLQAFLDDLVYFKARSFTKQLPELVEAALSSLARGSTLVLMVHPYLFGDPRLEALLRYLVQRQHRVLAILFEGPEFGVLGRNKDRETPEINAYHYEAQLRRLRVEAHVITCGDPLETVFRGDVGA